MFPSLSGAKSQASVHTVHTQLLKRKESWSIKSYQSHPLTSQTQYLPGQTGSQPICIFALRSPPKTKKHCNKFWPVSRRWWQPWWSAWCWTTLAAQRCESLLPQCRQRPRWAAWPAQTRSQAYCWRRAETAVAWRCLAGESWICLLPRGRWGRTLGLRRKTHKG